MNVSCGFAAGDVQNTQRLRQAATISKRKSSRVLMHRLTKPKIGKDFIYGILTIL